MEDKKAQAIARGKRAELLLKDELLTECFTEIEKTYIEGWKRTPVRDTELRERFWQGVQVVGKVREHLIMVANNGKLEQRELDDLAAPQKRGIFNIV